MGGFGLVVGVGWWLGGVCLAMMAYLVLFDSVWGLAQLAVVCGLGCWDAMQALTCRVDCGVSCDLVVWFSVLLLAVVAMVVWFWVWGGFRVLGFGFGVVSCGLVC